MITSSSYWLVLVLAVVIFDSFSGQVRGAPSVFGFEPKAGLAGTEVTISGQGLETANRVLFNGVEAQFSIDVPAGSITAVVPSGAVTGRILVFTSDGFAASDESFVIGQPGPEIVQFTRSAPVGADVVLVLNVAVPVQSVAFNGAETTFRPIGDTLILTRVPFGATSGLITLTFEGGTAVSREPFVVDAIPVEGLPKISEFTPTQAYAGEQVLITGVNLADTVLAVQFGGVAATFAQRPDGVFATVPPGATTGVISIITLAGVANSSTPFVVRHEPEILRFEPTSGGIGAQIQILGHGLAEATNVMFNGHSAGFEVDTVTGSLIVSVPREGSTGPITVVTPTGTAVSREDFVFLPASSITTFTPSGKIGASVVLALNPGPPVTQVLFNGGAAPFAQILMPPGSLVLTWVPDTATTGEIVVSLLDGSTSSTGTFTVTDQPSERVPQIFALSPNEAAVGESVLITGINLSDEVMAVQFNGVQANFAQGTDGLVATVPVGARAGSVSVITRFGLARSIEPFVLGPPYGPRLNVLPMSWDRELCLIWDADNDPAILGYKLHLADAKNRLFFITDIPGGGANSSCDSIDLRSILPNNGIYSAYVTAYDFAGEESAPSERIYFELRPSVTSLSASSGYADDRILLSGAGFLDVTEVRFGGTEAEFQILDSTEIQVKVPASAPSGSIELTTPGGSTFVPNEFRVLPSCDLRVKGTVPQQKVFANSEFTYSFSVENLGLVDARNVRLSITLPAAFEMIDARLDGNPMVPLASGELPNIETLPDGASIHGTITMRANAAGLYSLKAAVQTESIDRNLANNSDLARLEVLPVPVLQIKPLNIGQIQVSWTAPRGSFSLESTTPNGLSPEDWEPVTEDTQFADGVNSVVLPTGKMPHVFRLRAISP